MKLKYLNYIMSILKNHNDIGILILDLTLQYKFEMKGHWLNTSRCFIVMIQLTNTSKNCTQKL